ncbi:unnamed protein product [Effrenium voratum]|uniref:Uncharacterized protein n=1 Tax=Effrenium voratum TaxID=2562239 RepID=A0AA36N9C8_9DINO|nr:unnamed protein product [Effrenium voratum]
MRAMHSLLRLRLRLYWRPRGLATRPHFPSFKADLPPEVAAPGFGHSGLPTSEEFGEILFEDLPEEFAKEAFEAEEPVVRPLPREAPLSDEELREANVLTLSREEFVWAVGRAATIGLPATARLWRDLPHAIHAFGAKELSESELCRLLQALAYAPRDVALDKPLLRRLFKVFALRAKAFSDEQLMRVLYAYGKLADKRGIQIPEFMDFATSEVVERDASLKPWRKVRILESVGALPEAGAEFKSLIVGQILKAGAQSLDAERFAEFVPMAVDAKHTEREGTAEKLNAVLRRKLKHIHFSNPDLILACGMPMFFFDLMKTSVLSRWLDRLARLDLPLTEGARVRTGLAYVDVDVEDTPRRRAKKPRNQDWLQPADAKRATKNLEALKQVELVLRHQRESSMESLTPPGLRLLKRARDLPLQPPPQYDMPELPHVYAGLSKLFRKLGVLLHPTVYGPYLLELADPLGQLAVEWDSSWQLYPPWRRARHQEFVQRKHFHLRAEGWKVLEVPLAKFQALSREEELGFLEDFAKRLEHLRVAAESESGIRGDKSADAFQSPFAQLHVTGLRRRVEMTELRLPSMDSLKLEMRFSAQSLVYHLPSHNTLLQAGTQISQAHHGLQLQCSHWWGVTIRVGGTGTVETNESVSYREPDASFVSMDWISPSLDGPPTATSHQKHVRSLNFFLKRLEVDKTILKDEVKLRRMDAPL